MLERPDEQQHLFLDHFFLLTSASPHEERASDLLARYRRRGTAEGDFGAFKSTVGPTLSSSPRPKSHYRGRPSDAAPDDPDTFAANDAKLLLAFSRRISWPPAPICSAATTTSAEPRTVPAFLLKTAARVLLGSGYVTVVIAAARAPLWQRFRSALQALPPARGSPAPQALPVPA